MYVSFSAGSVDLSVVYLPVPLNVLLTGDAMS